ncbi:pilus assembly protein [Acidovorax sp. FJL06]|uniref:pilus assembly protein n=1 Tax=Acidovorax sp. FJL06 TaxID=2153365 RepID=UPI000F58E58D|nr:PilC/PilY family type IV pilus protein [Acidovorax sp. FJL06]RQO82053.1 hypothetical protein DBV10_10290 [Acidovorax sp. FJL06]
MRITNHPQRTTLAILIAAIWAPLTAWSAQIPLVQYPAGTAYKAPVPNVILTVDTSGSMGTVDSGQTKSRLKNVIDGLNGTLINSTKYDGQFRLAWQSFTCNNIPSNGGNCAGKNAMGKFESTHKTDFGTWVSKLVTGTSSGTTNTPSHMVVWNAGEYLKTTGSDNPWNATPGTADSSPLACRRAYHIFLTDGGWNYSTPTTYYPANPPSKAGAADGFSFNTKIRASDPLAQSMQNADGKAATFPDGTTYSIASNQTKIYRDAYGANRTIKNTNDNITYAYPTLADMAFYHWATDLQPGINNSVISKIRKTGTETYNNGTGASAKSVTFDEYWNPKNDPANWQHLVQYTIGYGDTAASLTKINTTSPQWAGGMFSMYNTDSNGVGYASLAVGNTTWDDVTSAAADGNYDGYRPQEMWHMSINSRGKYYPVTGDLTAVFADIFDDIVVDTTAPISGFTSASGSVSRVGTQSFQTNYIAADDGNSNDNRWYGHVTSSSIDTSGNFTPNADWGLASGSTTKGLSTADKLATVDINTRLILSYKVQTTPASTGISFKWANLSTSTTGASQQMWLNNGTVGSTSTIAGDSRGQDRLDFIRGDRTKEASNYSGSNTTATFRNRKNRQGDIVNSAIWYVGPPASGNSASSYSTFAANNRGRLPMLYVGGNDGMLHGFSAKDGTEKIAYVPHGAVQNLSSLTNTSYDHRYYVDGSPLSGDINIGTTASPDWRSYLVGTMGAGGRGFFVLDVTKPGPLDSSSSVPSPATNFSEANAASLVVMDKTAAPISDAVPPAKPADANASPDIGHIFGAPVVAESNQQLALQITRTNDGRWAYITGNGYNSANERPVLLIQYLDGDKSLKTIPAVAVGAAEAVGNGLSTPQFLDVNGDGSPDFVYAGDLRGNMWKFDISNIDATQWGVAFSGSPLFTATYTSGGSTSRQPITAPPVLRPNRTVGGLMVAFGTGQNLTEGDRSDTSVQTVYSILDNTSYLIENTGANAGKVKVKTSGPTPATVSGRSALQAEAVNDGADNTTAGTGLGTAGAGVSTGRSFWTLTTQEVKYVCKPTDAGCTVKMGWYMDLPVAGERVTSSFAFYNGGNTLEIISEKPASGSATATGQEVCAPQPSAAKTYRTLVNIASGAPAPLPIMDVNGDGLYNSSDMSGTTNYARMSSSSKELRFTTGTKQIRKGNDGKSDALKIYPPLLLRPGWRQLK